MDEYVVKQITKKGKKYLVEFKSLDDVLELNEDLIVEYRIIKDAIFDKKTFNKIKKSESEVLYYNKVLHYIDFKPRTKKEVEKYLGDFDLSKELIDKIIKKLIKISYIDDERFARSYTLEAIRKQKGRLYILKELETKGISKDITSKYLEEYDKELEIENAKKVALKLAKTISKNPLKKQKIQLSNKLLIEGYSYDIISYVINSIELSDESEELLEKEYNKLLLKDFDKNVIIQKLLSKGFDYSNIRKLIEK